MANLDLSDRDLRLIRSALLVSAVLAMREGHDEAAQDFHDLGGRVDEFLTAIQDD
jgi:hypothetical protein